MSPEAVLIDTSAWLLALGRNPVPAIRERVREHLEKRRVVMVPMVSLELLGRAKSEGEFYRLKSRLEALPQIDIDSRIWREAARTAFHLRRQGKTIPYTDVLIGTAALEAKALLLHCDQHFDTMAEVTGLAVESLLPLLRGN